MRTFVIGLAAVALIALGCGSSGAEDAAVEPKSAAEKVSEAPKTSEPAAEKASKPMDPSVSGVVDEGKSAKQQLSDDSADNKKRVKKGFGNATDDIKRTFRGLGKKD